MTYFLRFSILSLCCIFSMNLMGQPMLQLSGEGEDFIVPKNYLFVFEDSSNQLTLQDIQNNHEADFAETHDLFPHVVNTESAYWVRFTCVPEFSSDKRWVIEVLDPHFTSVSIFLPRDSIYMERKAGFGIPFFQREYLHKNFVFDIPFEKNKPLTFYMRLTSKDHNVFLFKIRTHQFFTGYSLYEYFILGMYYGILAIVALYNLLLYFNVREKFYLYYVIYVISCAVVSFSEDGLGFHFIWAGIPELNPLVTFYSPIVFLLCFALYARSFLEIPRNAPVLNKVINVTILLYALNFILDLKLFDIRHHSLVYAFPYFLIYATALYIYLRGYTPARFFVVAYTFILISIVILILRLKGIINPDHLFTIYSFNFGIVFEIFILSYALGDKIKLIKMENEKAQKKIIEQLLENEKLKDQVNRELEYKVKERTKELAEQKEIVSQKNIQLEDAFARVQAQADEIARMNALLNEENIELSVQNTELQEENKELEVNVKELSKARVFSKDVDFQEFLKIFPDKEACIRYLEELKWSKGYECLRCKNEKSFEGHEPLSRRCTKCGYDESPMAYTIFHRLRFPITKAFYMLFLIYSNKGKISSVELSQIINLRQSTCWSFRKKILDKLSKKKKGISSEDGWSKLVLEDRK